MYGTYANSIAPGVTPQNAKLLYLKVKAGNDQETAQSVRSSHPINRGENEPN